MVREARAGETVSGLGVMKEVVVMRELGVMRKVVMASNRISIGKGRVVSNPQPARVGGCGGAKTVQRQARAVH